MKHFNKYKIGIAVSGFIVALALMVVVDVYHPTKITRLHCGSWQTSWEIHHRYRYWYFQNSTWVYFIGDNFSRSYQPVRGEACKIEIKIGVVKGK